MNPNRFYYEINQSFSFYHSVTANPQGFDTHIHRSYEILHFVSGNATYYIEGNSYDMQANDIIFTNTRELHKIVFHSEKPYERKFVQFRPEFIVGLQLKDYNPLTIFENRKLGYHNLIQSVNVTKYGIDRYFNALHKHSKTGTPADNAMIKTLLIQMLIIMNQIFEENNRGKKVVIRTNEKVEKILDYINNNLDKKISLDLLEDIFFLNKYHLCRIFKQSTGFSVIEYTTYKRIMHAKELLASGIQAINVAYSVGYDDYSTFYRAFKKTVGISPKKYAEKYS